MAAMLHCLRTPPQRSRPVLMGGSLSAKDFKSCMHDEGLAGSTASSRSQGGSVSRAASSSPPPSQGRRTMHSGRMAGSEGMRQILGHCPGSMQRVSSLPPRLFGLQNNQDHVEGGSPCSWDLSSRGSALASGSLMGSPTSTHRETLGGSSPGRARLWDVDRRPSTAQSARPWSPVSAVSSARTGSASTTATSALSSARGAERPPAPRLRGAGRALGEQGKSSARIPWRQLPAYSSAGALAGTGDAFGTGTNRLSELGLHHRRSAEFSPKLGCSGGVKDVLKPVLEHRQCGKVEAQAAQAQHECALASDAAGRASPRQAWIEVLRQRQHSKYDTSQFLKAAANDGITQVPEGKSGPHWTYRQQRKNVSSIHSSKDSCPFSRDDSAPSSRTVQSPTPHARRTQSPPSNIEGTAAQASAVGEQVQHHPDWHAFAAEKVAGSGRSSGFLQNVVGRTEQADTPDFQRRCLSPPVTRGHLSTVSAAPPTWRI
mmetsp:Transcript_163390/g.523882  ORF Transcript_163390/g.523882 Transcript_163390/m.523882 type:complete len:486 (+) Transcript_163390:49-1506(+)